MDADSQPTDASVLFICSMISHTQTQTQVYIVRCAAVRLKYCFLSVKLYYTRLPSSLSFVDTALAAAAVSQFSRRARLPQSHTRLAFAVCKKSLFESRCVRVLTEFFALRLYVFSFDFFFLFLLIARTFF